MIADKTYHIDGTVYRILIVDTDEGRVIVAPGFHWGDQGYGTSGPISESWLLDRMAFHKVRKGDRHNLVVAILAAVDAHGERVGVEP